MNIYQIKQEYAELIGQLIENGGEMTEELGSALAITEDNLKDKIENYVFAIRNIEGEADALSNEIARLKALKDSREKTIERLKTTVSGALQFTGNEAINFPLFKVSLRKSQQVKLSEGFYHPDFARVKQVIEPDKVKLKASLQAGEDIPGAALVTNFNLQIK